MQTRPCFRHASSFSSRRYSAHTFAFSVVPRRGQRTRCCRPDVGPSGSASVTRVPCRPQGPSGLPPAGGFPRPPRTKPVWSGEGPGRRGAAPGLSAAAACGEGAAGRSRRRLRGPLRLPPPREAPGHATSVVDVLQSAHGCGRW